MSMYRVVGEQIVWRRMSGWLCVDVEEDVDSDHVDERQQCQPDEYPNPLVSKRIGANDVPDELQHSGLLVGLEG